MVVRWWCGEMLRWWDDVVVRCWCGDVGRGFAQFQDVIKNRENSPYVNWFYRIDAGRKVRRAGSYCRCSRYLLGKEQRPFYGRSTCEIHKVSCNRIYRNFHSSESEFLRNLQNCHRQVLLNAWHVKTLLWLVTARVFFSVTGQKKQHTDSPHDEQGG